MARTFDGVDDYWKGTIGACSAGYGTFASIARIATDANYGQMFAQHTSADAGQQGVARVGASSGQMQWWNGTAEALSPSTLLVDTVGWVCAAASKATGTVAPRFHRYLYSTDSWTHENSVTSLADGGAGGAGGFALVGKWGTSDFFTGDIALTAWWAGVVLTDAQIESLPFSLTAWSSLAPSGLWIFDQAATTTNVIDMTGGGANQNTLVGTTVATASVPVFSYGASMPWSRQPAGGAPPPPGVTWISNSPFLRW